MFRKTKDNINNKFLSANQKINFSKSTKESKSIASIQDSNLSHHACERIAPLKPKCTVLAFLPDKLPLNQATKGTKSKPNSSSRKKSKRKCSNLERDEKELLDRNYVTIADPPKTGENLDSSSSINTFPSDINCTISRNSMQMFDTNAFQRQRTSTYANLSLNSSLLSNKERDMFVNSPHTNAYYSPTQYLANISNNQSELENRISQCSHVRTVVSQTYNRSNKTICKCPVQSQLNMRRRNIPLNSLEYDFEVNTSKEVLPQNSQSTYLSSNALAKDQWISLNSARDTSVGVDEDLCDVNDAGKLYPNAVWKSDASDSINKRESSLPVQGFTSPIKYKKDVTPPPNMLDDTLNRCDNGSQNELVQSFLDNGMCVSMTFEVEQSYEDDLEDDLPLFLKDKISAIASKDIPKFTKENMKRKDDLPLSYFIKEELIEDEIISGNKVVSSKINEQINSGKPDFSSNPTVLSNSELNNYLISGSPNFLPTVRIETELDSKIPSSQPIAGTYSQTSFAVHSSTSSLSMQETNTANNRNTSGVNLKDTFKEINSINNLHTLSDLPSYSSYELDQIKPRINSQKKLNTDEHLCYKTSNEKLSIPSSKIASKEKILKKTSRRTKRKIADQFNNPLSNTYESVPEIAQNTLSDNLSKMSPLNVPKPNINFASCSIPVSEVRKKVKKSSKRKEVTIEFVDFEDIPIATLIKRQKSAATDINAPDSFLCKRGNIPANDTYKRSIPANDHIKDLSSESFSKDSSNTSLITPYEDVWSSLYSESSNKNKKPRSSKKGKIPPSGLKQESATQKIRNTGKKSTKRKSKHSNQLEAKIINVPYSNNELTRTYVISSKQNDNPQNNNLHSDVDISKKDESPYNENSDNLRNEITSKFTEDLELKTNTLACMSFAEQNDVCEEDRHSILSIEKEMHSLGGNTVKSSANLRHAHSFVKNIKKDSESKLLEEQPFTSEDHSCSVFSSQVTDVSLELSPLKLKNMCIKLVACEPSVILSESVGTNSVSKKNKKQSRANNWYKDFFSETFSKDSSDASLITPNEDARSSLYSEGSNENKKPRSSKKGKISRTSGLKQESATQKRRNTGKKSTNRKSKDSNQLEANVSNVPYSNNELIRTDVISSKQNDNPRNTNLHSDVDVSKKDKSPFNENSDNLRNGIMRKFTEELEYMSFEEQNDVSGEDRHSFLSIEMAMHSLGGNTVKSSPNSRYIHSVINNIKKESELNILEDQSFTSEDHSCSVFSSHVLDTSLEPSSFKLKNMSSKLVASEPSVILPECVSNNYVSKKNRKRRRANNWYKDFFSESFSKDSSDASLITPNEDARSSLYSESSNENKKLRSSKKGKISPTSGLKQESATQKRRNTGKKSTKRKSKDSNQLGANVSNVPYSNNELTRKDVISSKQNDNPQNNNLHSELDVSKKDESPYNENSDNLRNEITSKFTEDLESKTNTLAYMSFLKQNNVSEEDRHSILSIEKEMHSLGGNTLKSSADLRHAHSFVRNVKKDSESKILEEQSFTSEDHSCSVFSSQVTDVSLELSSLKLKNMCIKLVACEPSVILSESVGTNSVSKKNKKQSRANNWYKDFFSESFSKDSSDASLITPNEDARSSLYSESSNENKKLRSSKKGKISPTSGLKQESATQKRRNTGKKSTKRKSKDSNQLGANASNVPYSNNELTRKDVISSKQNENPRNTNLHSDVDVSKKDESPYNGNSNDLRKEITSKFTEDLELKTNTLTYMSFSEQNNVSEEDCHSILSIEKEMHSLGGNTVKYSADLKHAHSFVKNIKKDSESKILEEQSFTSKDHSCSGFSSQVTDVSLELSPLKLKNMSIKLVACEPSVILSESVGTNSVSKKNRKRRKSNNWGKKKKSSKSSKLKNSCPSIADKNVRKIASETDTPKMFTNTETDAEKILSKTDSSKIVSEISADLPSKAISKRPAWLIERLLTDLETTSNYCEKEVQDNSLYLEQEMALPIKGKKVNKSKKASESKSKTVKIGSKSRKTKNSTQLLVQCTNNKISNRNTEYENVEYLNASKILDVSQKQLPIFSTDGQIENIADSYDPDLETRDHRNSVEISNVETTLHRTESTETLCASYEEQLDSSQNITEIEDIKQTSIQNTEKRAITPSLKTYEIKEEIADCESIFAHNKVIQDTVRSTINRSQICKTGNLYDDHMISNSIHKVSNSIFGSTPSNLLNMSDNSLKLNTNHQPIEVKKELEVESPQHLSSSIVSSSFINSSSTNNNLVYMKDSRDIVSSGNYVIFNEIQNPEENLVAIKKEPSADRQDQPLENISLAHGNCRSFIVSNRFSNNQSTEKTLAVGSQKDTFQSNCTNLTQPKPSDFNNDIALSIKKEVYNDGISTSCDSFKITSISDQNKLIEVDANKLSSIPSSLTNISSQENLVCPPSPLNEINSVDDEIQILNSDVLKDVPIIDLTDDNTTKLNQDAQGKLSTFNNKNIPNELAKSLQCDKKGNAQEININSLNAVIDVEFQRSTSVFSDNNTFNNQQNSDSMLKLKRDVDHSNSSKNKSIGVKSNFEGEDICSTVERTAINPLDIKKKYDEDYFQYPFPPSTASFNFDYLPDSRQNILDIRYCPIKQTISQNIENKIMTPSLNISEIEEEIAEYESILSHNRLIPNLVDISENSTKLNKNEQPVEANKELKTECHQNLRDAVDSSLFTNSSNANNNLVYIKDSRDIVLSGNHAIFNKIRNLEENLVAIKKEPPLYSQDHSLEAELSTYGNCQSFAISNSLLSNQSIHKISPVGSINDTFQLNSTNLTPLQSKSLDVKDKIALSIKKEVCNDEKSMLSNFSNITVIGNQYNFINADINNFSKYNIPNSLTNISSLKNAVCSSSVLNASSSVDDEIQILNIDVSKDVPLIDLTDNTPKLNPESRAKLSTLNNKSIPNELAESLQSCKKINAQENNKHSLHPVTDAEIQRITSVFNGNNTVCNKQHSDSISKRKNVRDQPSSPTNKSIDVQSNFEVEDVCPAVKRETNNPFLIIKKYTREYLQYPFPPSIVSYHTIMPKNKIKTYSRINLNVLNLPIETVESRLNSSNNVKRRFWNKFGDVIKLHEFPVSSSEVQCYHRILGVAPSQKLISKCFKFQDRKVDISSNNFSMFREFQEPIEACMFENKPKNLTEFKISPDSCAPNTPLSYDRDFSSADSKYSYDSYISNLSHKFMGDTQKKELKNISLKEIISASLEFYNMCADANSNDRNSAFSCSTSETLNLSENEFTNASFSSVETSVEGQLANSFDANEISCSPNILNSLTLPNKEILDSMINNCDLKSSTPIIETDDEIVLKSYKLGNEPDFSNGLHLPADSHYAVKSVPQLSEMNIDKDSITSEKGNTSQKAVNSNANINNMSVTELSKILATAGSLPLNIRNSAFSCSTSNIQNTLENEFTNVDLSGVKPSINGQLANSFDANEIPCSPYILNSLTLPSKEILNSIINNCDLKSFTPNMESNDEHILQFSKLGNEPVCHELNLSADSHKSVQPVLQLPKIDMDMGSSTNEKGNTSQNAANSNFDIINMPVTELRKVLATAGCMHSDTNSDVKKQCLWKNKTTFEYNHTRAGTIIDVNSKQNVENKDYAAYSSTSVASINADMKGTFLAAKNSTVNQLENDDSADYIEHEYIGKVSGNDDESLNLKRSRCKSRFEKIKERKSLESKEKENESEFLFKDIFPISSNVKVRGNKFNVPDGAIFKPTHKIPENPKKNGFPKMKSKNYSPYLMKSKNDSSKPIKSLDFITFGDSYLEDFPKVINSKQNSKSKHVVKEAPKSSSKSKNIKGKEKIIDDASNLFMPDKQVKINRKEKERKKYKTQ